MRKSTVALIIAATLCGFGCQPSPLEITAYNLIDAVPADWKLSATDAIAASTKYCSDHSIDLSAYETPSLSCDSQDGERTWAILYSGVTPIPGNHFMLLLNDQTGEIEYVPGE